MEIEVKILPFNSELQLKSIELRREILRIPLKLNFTLEELANENNQIHIGAILNNEIVGVLLLKQIENTLKMRQVAVDLNFQNKGIGKKMVNFSENYAKKNGFKLIELNARITAVPFYNQLNYEIEGEIFEEVGIKHLKMIKIIE